MDSVLNQCVFYYLFFYILSLSSFASSLILSSFLSFPSPSLFLVFLFLILPLSSSHLLTFYLSLFPFLSLSSYLLAPLSLFILPSTSDSSNLSNLISFPSLSLFLSLLPSPCFFSPIPQSSNLTSPLLSFFLLLSLPSLFLSLLPPPFFSLCLHSAPIPFPLPQPLHH